MPGLQKPIILGSFVAAALCLAASILLTASDAFAAKKRKGGEQLVGWCWRINERSKHQIMCFGRIPDLKVTAGNRFEAFEVEGLYRTPNKGALQLLGFPGEGWLSNSPLTACEYEISDLTVMLISGCELSGRWDRMNRHPI